MKKIKPKKIKSGVDLLFEVSWEVCNRVGGIYRVLESKADQLVAHYGKNYYLIGPYFAERVKGEFQEKNPPLGFTKLFQELESEGINCHFGKWLIEGEPNVILIDFTHFLPQANKIKKELWESYGIDSLFSGYDFTEPVIWSWAVGKLIEKLARAFEQKKVISQFHEWLAGGGLLYLKKNRVKVGNIFITHATILGRTLANSNVPLYSLLGKIDPDREAYHYNIQAKYQLERAAAKHCDVFATVSEITALETNSFLGRKPDFLLPNGLDIGKFPTFEELAFKQRIQRARLREFLLYYFFPYYTFDIRRTLFYFVIGRYEFRNKGIDLFIKALGQLNRKLKKEKSQKTIVTFFWIPSQTKEIKKEVLESRENYQDIKDYLEEFSQDLRENIIQTLVAGERFEKASLFANGRDLLREFKKKRMKFEKQGFPPLSTHNLADPEHIILKSFQEQGLENKKEDRVKVVFYPLYLTGADGLLNLNYSESIQGSHLGVFPSFYEPWGYTTLETAALGVPALTSDLSGFGRFVLQFLRRKKYPGIFILKRFGKKEEDLVKGLLEILDHFSRLSRKEREENKIQAREMAELCDWKILIKNYIKAHNQALKKTR